MCAGAVAAIFGLAWYATPRPGFGDHVEIIGPVADRHRVIYCEAEVLAQLR